MTCTWFVGNLSVGVFEQPASRKETFSDTNCKSSSSSMRTSFSIKTVTQVYFAVIITNRYNGGQTSNGSN